jgi:NADP-reducing hydrogenase subunit HndA
LHAIREDKTFREVRALRTGKHTFVGTQQQKTQLLDAIDRRGCDSTELIAILQDAQAIYGYLPIEVQEIISLQMEIPLSEIYGVATFYAQFSLTPKGKYKISCCLGTACYVKGAGTIYEILSEKLGISSGDCTEDGKFSLEACRCIGACGLAPVMTVGDDVYGRLTKADIDRIIEDYKGRD